MLVLEPTTNNRTKLAASALQRPPTSMPRTIKRHRDARPNSGYVGAFVASAGTCKGCAGPAVAPQRRRGAPADVNGGHQGGVNCELRATPHRKSISNDLNAPLILPCSLEVEVADQHICRNSCAGFAADTCSGPFKRPTSLT